MSLTSSRKIPLKYHQKYDHKDIIVDYTDGLLDKIKVASKNGNFYFLIFLLQEIDSLIIDGIDFNVNKNDLILLTPYTTNNIKISEEFEGIMIGFSEQFYNISPVHHQFFFDTLAISNSPIYSAQKCDGSENDFICDIFKQVYDKYHSTGEDLIKWRIVRTLISVTFLYMQKRIPKKGIALHNHENPTTKKLIFDFVQLVNQHFRNKNQLSFYLEKLNVSKDVLYRKCKEILTISPKELIQNKVMSEAKRLLKNEENTVQEIAYYLGFSDDSNFIKFFQSRMKMTPRSFRKNNIN